MKVQLFVGKPGAVHHEQRRLDKEIFMEGFREWIKIRQKRKFKVYFVTLSEVEGHHLAPTRKKHSSASAYADAVYRVFNTENTKNGFYKVYLNLNK